MKKASKSSKNQKNFLSRLIGWLSTLLSSLCFIGGICLLAFGVHTLFNETLKAGLTYFFSGAGLILGGFLLGFLLDLLAKLIARLFPTKAEKANP